MRPHSGRTLIGTAALLMLALGGPAAMAQAADGAASAVPPLAPAAPVVVGNQVDLVTAWRAALVADPALQSALAGRDAAAEGIAVARARLLPQVTLQNTSQRLQQSTASRLGQTDFDGNSINSQLVLRQGVYRPRDRLNVDIARRQAEVSEQRLVQAQSELWQRTAQAWIDVLAAQAQRTLAERSLQAAGVWAEQETRRLRSGEGTRDAVAEAAAQRAAAAARVTETTLDLQARLRAFNLVTGLSVSAISGHRLPAVPGDGLADETEAALLDRVLAGNPELVAARINEAIAQHRLTQAGTDHLPTLDVVGSVAQAQNDTTNTLGSRYHNRQLGLQLVIPIYAGGGVDAAQRQAAAALAAASAEREAVAQRLRNQFTTDWHVQAGLRERAIGARQLVEAAQEQRRAVDMALARGLKSLADLGNVDVTLARREADALDISAQWARTQSRVLALLPASDPVWARWAQGLVTLAAQTPPAGLPATPPSKPPATARTALR